VEFRCAHLYFLKAEATSFAVSSLCRQFCSSFILTAVAIGTARCLFCVSKEKVVCMFAGLHYHTSGAVRIALLITSIYIPLNHLSTHLDVAEISQDFRFL